MGAASNCLPKCGEAILICEVYTSMPTIKDSEGNEHELKVGQLVQVTKYEGVCLMRIHSFGEGNAYAFDYVADNSVIREHHWFTWISDEPMGEEKEPTLQQRRGRLLINLDRAYRMSSYDDRMTLGKLTDAIYKEGGENVWFWKSVAESMDDPRQVSYAPTKEAYDINAKRKRCRVAKFLKTVAKRFGLDVTNAEADRIGELVGAHFPDSYDYQFEVVRGPEGVYAAYSDRANEGWGSCMYAGGGMAKRCVRWYDENPDKVGLVKIKQGRNYVGRALIWNTDDGSIVVDRCYPSDNGPQTTALHAWAIKNGYDYKTAQSYVDGCLKSGRESYRVTMKPSSNGDYPYCDTFKYTNDPPDDSDTIVLNMEEGEYKFSETDGGWEGRDDDRFVCESCSERVNENDVFSCDQGYSYCESCYDDRFTHLDYRNPNGLGRCGTYNNDDVSTCDCCNEDRHRNDLCDVEVGTRTQDWCLSCVEDRASTCQECGNLCDIDQGGTLGEDGDWVCDECQKDVAAECEECNTWYRKEDMLISDDRTLCADCCTDEDATPLIEPVAKQEVQEEAPVTAAPVAAEVDSYPACGPILRPREDCCDRCVAVRRRRFDEFNSRRWDPDDYPCVRDCATCRNTRAERDAYVNAPYPNDEEKRGAATA
jgi:hypothetical protein